MNLNLAYFFAKRYRHSPRYEDIIQECIIALVLAYQHYNPAKGKLSTYAGYWITTRLARYFEKISHYEADLSLEEAQNYIEGIAQNLVLNDYVSERDLFHTEKNHRHPSVSRANSH